MDPCKQQREEVPPCLGEILSRDGIRGHGRTNQEVIRPNRVHPNAVCGTLDAIEAKFGIPVIWCGILPRSAPQVGFQNTLPTGGWNSMGMAGC